MTVLIVSVPANSFELFGKCFGKDCKEKTDIDSDIIDPKTYTIEFNLSGDASDDVITVVKAKSELWRGRDKAVGGSAGLISRAKGDYRRILAGLYSEGFYAGEISITINASQAVDLNPGTDLPQNSVVSVDVNSGNLYRFGKFDIINPAPEALDENDVVEKPKSLQNQPGDIARANQVRITSKLAIEEWRQQGYPKAQISDQDIKALHAERKLNVRLGLEPGPRATYGNVIIQGAKKVDPEFIAYMTGLNRGDEYDPDDIERAKKRLDKLDVFSVRKIDEDAGITDQGELPLTVIVDEKKQRRIGLGATVSTTDGAGFEAYWLHRNLFGKAERLRLEAEIGGIGETFEGDELDYRLGATLTKPGVFIPDTDWVTNIFAQREFNDTFEGETAGGSSVLTHLYSDKITFSGGGFVEYSRFEDAFGERDFFSAGLIGTVTYDGRDSKLDPTKGFYARFEAKPFHEFEFENTGARLDAEFRGYLAIDEEAETVLAGRIKLGSLVGLDRDESPTNFLYFAGGGGSVRGFGFKNIGVIEANNDITGGRSLFETSFEVRQRLTDTIGIVGFVDAGTVSADSFIDFSQDLRVSAGAGLRYYTGLGPIRLDVAIPLNPQSGDPDFGIFAGIGQAF